jgi:hypothetical protein
MLDMSTTATTFLHKLFGHDEEPLAGPAALTLRLAGPADAEALARLAQLDSRRVPDGTVLVGEVDGELWAATSLDDGHMVADPFRPTGGVLALLTQRAHQLRRANGSRPVAGVWTLDRAALN